MGKVKEIKVKLINAKTANDFVRKYHYSGKITLQSVLHFGCFLNGLLHGVLQFGVPTDLRKTIPLVKGTLWREMLELNRMALDDYLPRNSESRCLSVALKIIRKQYPHLKWILSFSDGAQSGDGTIYRATGFYLTQIKKSTANIIMPDGEVIPRISVTIGTKNQKGIYRKVMDKYNIDFSGKASISGFIKAGGKIIPGFQLRYIYFLHKDEIKNLTCPILPFSKIDEMGAGMYRGERIKVSERKPISEYSVDRCTPVIQTGSGGAEPTYSLNLNQGSANA